jgi:hypothetical protein
VLETVNEDFVAGFGNINCHKDALVRDKLVLGHGRSISGMRLRTPSF